MPRTAAVWCIDVTATESIPVRERTGLGLIGYGIKRPTPAISHGSSRDRRSVDTSGLLEWSGKRHFVTESFPYPDNSPPACFILDISPCNHYFNVQKNCQRYNYRLRVMVMVRNRVSKFVIFKLWWRGECIGERPANVHTTFQ